MIAYRAETALSMIVKHSLSKPNEATTLIRTIFNSEADLLANPERKELLIRIPPLATPRENQAAQSLLDHLNETEFVNPGTELRLRYIIGRQDDFENRPTANS